MDEILKRISEGLVRQSSRRGFFSTVGTVVLGAAAAVAGRGFLTQTALAQGLQCCTGTSCSTSTGCPGGTMSNYTWCCVYPSTTHVSCTYPLPPGGYTCYDCYKVNRNGHVTGDYVCTYAA